MGKLGRNSRRASHRQVLTGVYLTGVHAMVVHLIGIYLTGLYLMSVHRIGMYPHRRVSYLRVFLKRRTRVARIPILILRMFEASDCGRLGRQAADHPWSALRVVKAAEKTTQRPRCCSKPKAAALHPERYQSSLSKLSKRGGSRRGKEAQAIGLASQSDRQTGERQTG